MDNIDFNKLWNNFVDIVTNHYMDFNGRVGRTQFWWYVAVTVAIIIVADIVGSVVPLVATVVGLALLLPNLGMIVRRMHDVGKPGIWVALLAVPLVLTILMGLLAAVGAGLGMLWLLALFAGLAGIIWIVTLVGLIVLIYFCAQPGQAEPNTYGAPAAAWSPGK
ncbi:MAG: DUF805 domain-containing protein [Proteobacteria bacterium]|nr:DUF805 domain-containing protein [Pseudomonadota bacterium]